MQRDRGEKMVRRGSDDRLTLSSVSFDHLPDADSHADAEAVAGFFRSSS